MKNWIRNNKGNILFFIFMFAIVILFNFFKPIRIAHVNGNSMNSTLSHGQYVVFYKKEPKRNDVIIFKAPDTWDKEKGKWLVKRAVGVPGDTIKITKDSLFVNDKLILNFTNYGKKENIKPTEFTLVNQYFFLGDNYFNSYDSLNRFLENKMDYLIEKNKVKYSREIERNEPKATDKSYIVY